MIHGVPFWLRCDHAAARENIEGHLSAYAVAGGGKATAGGVSVEIEYREVQYPVPLHARRVLLYDAVRCYVLDGRTYFTDYFSTLAIDPEGRTIRGNLSPDTLRDYGLNRFVHIQFTLALFEALRLHGLFYLHASALQGPDGTGYVLCGNAGSGKTTLTLCLIESGFKFLSDDTVFLRLSGDRDVEVLGFARAFHLAADLIAEREFLGKFRELPDFCPRRGRKLLSADRCFPERRLDGMVNPQVILFPCIREDASRLESLSRAEALNILIPQSLAVMFNPETAPPHLEALKRMASRGRAFCLFTGPEIKGSPAAVRTLVEQARDQAQTKEGDAP